MSLDQIDEVTEQNMVTLRQNLRDLGVDAITNLPLSPMNIRIAQLVRGAEHRNTAEGEILEQFERMAAAERRYAAAPDGIMGNTRAVLIWSGGKLNQDYVGRLRAAYLRLNAATRTDILQSQSVAKTIADGILPEHLAQQGLDQENIHPEAMRDTARILTEFVGDRISVFIPPDNALIRLTTELRLPANAVPYQVAHNSVAFPNVPANQYLIVVTIGHGSDQGLAWFPPVRGVAPQAVAGALPAPQHAALCVPLQCYPQQSRARWQAVRHWAPNITVKTLDNLAESTDAEMVVWITNHLRVTIADWFYGL
jgi:hypothetical protein